ncbi:hypothetical protein PtB15_1B477 [Puccinia triticina]|nr:hypothetical protein PtB15_1B477 [Puccinia triticina]
MHALWKHAMEAHKGANVHNSAPPRSSPPKETLWQALVFQDELITRGNHTPKGSKSQDAQLTDDSLQRKIMLQSSSRRAPLRLAQNATPPGAKLDLAPDSLNCGLDIFLEAELRL